MSTDPVSIRQVDADGRRGIFITTQHRRTDDIGRDALDNGFAETGIHRGMILEPLGIPTDGLRTFGSLFVNIFDKSLPGAFQSQRITIDLNESVDEINGRIMLFQPFNTIFIENLQIT